jgi:hypothetical protein
LSHIVFSVQLSVRSLPFLLTCFLQRFLRPSTVPASSPGRKGQPVHRELFRVQPGGRWRPCQIAAGRRSLAIPYVSRFALSHNAVAESPVPIRNPVTACGRCRCGSGLIPSAGACPRCSSPCSPPSGPSLGRVSTSGRRSSLSGINSSSSNARRRRDPAWSRRSLVVGTAGAAVAEVARRIQIVTPATVVRWHRHGFALYWGWKSRPRRVGRPAVDADIRALIRRMQVANPLRGAPRIHGELQKIGLPEGHVARQDDHRNSRLRDGGLDGDLENSRNLPRM